MNALMANLITGIILLVIISAACVYIYKEKKKGTRCIGCPMAGQCHKKDICDKTA